MTEPLRLEKVTDAQCERIGKKIVAILKEEGLRPIEAGFILVMVHEMVEKELAQ